MITKSVIGHQSTRAYALAELLNVAHQQAYRATNEGTGDPKAALMRVQNLLHAAGECADNLAADLSDLIAAAEPEKPEAPPVSDDLHSLELTIFACSVLRVNGINTVGKLISLTVIDLLKLPNVGQKTIDNIKRALESKGLSLAPEASK